MIQYLFLCLLTFSLIGCGATSDATSDEEQEILEITKRYKEAINQNDPEATAQFWEKNATHLNPQNGEFYQGRQAIEEMFRSLFVKRKGFFLEMQVRDISFPQPDQAIETGSAKISDDEGVYRNLDYKIVFFKNNGKWLIHEAREINTQEPPSHFAHLEQLAWFVGKWIDQDENVDINSSVSFDQNKNFLIQRLNLKIFGKNELNVVQVIGWDPLLEQIRSWIFDSDGGFGEGFWTQQENSWLVKTKYILPDGRKGSSINIYTKINDDTYTWSSIARDVDGELLPNIEPVKVVKIKEGEENEK